MKRFLRITVSVLTLPVLYWIVRCSINLYYITGLADTFPTYEYRMLFNEHLAELSCFITLFSVCISILLMLLYKGTLPEISKKIYHLKAQIFDLCVLIAISTLLFFNLNKSLGVTATILGFSVTLSITLIAINTVGLFNDHRRRQDDIP